MAQVDFRIEIEDDIKNKAEQVLKEMGLDISTAITMFLAEVGNEQCIPFEISEEWPPHFLIITLHAPVLWGRFSILKKVG